MNPPVSVNIRLSVALWRLYYLIHIIAGLLILVCPAVLPIKALALALLSISCFISYRYIQGQARVTRLQLSPEQSFVWLDGQKRACEVIGNPFVSPFLVVVTFRLTGHDVGRGRRFSAMLLPDSASVDELRELRVFLLTMY